MARRKYNLPGIEDLNKDQDKVLRLPEDGQFLVIGGPGTGKSVVALLRVLKYMEKMNYVFLTYNKVLLSATLQLVNTKLESRTLTSVIYKAYWKHFKKETPEIEKFKPDYEQIIRDFQELDCKPTSLHLVIDEGQDMPPKFYEALQFLCIENFFVVADQNQQLDKDYNSNKKELLHVLGLEIEDVIELKQNYRNSYPIAKLCQTFYTDPASPPPELPPKSKNGSGKPILYEYTHYNDCIKKILREYDDNNHALLGVIVANNDIREVYYNALQTTDIKRDFEKPIILTYSSASREEPNIDFSQSGIVVLNDKSIKGLEFDKVFIIIDGFTIYNNDIDSMKKRFYVMSSRAIDKLVYFKHKDYTGGVEKILTDDEDILKRGRL